MNNAEKFQVVFGYYATEMWAKPEAEFLDWINSEYSRDREIDLEIEQVWADMDRTDTNCSENPND